MLNTKAEHFRYNAAWILFFLLAFVCIFGSYLMPHRIDPVEKNTFHWELINGKNTMVSAPYPPDAIYWFGTDHRGYDLLSLLLNGAKYTLGFVLLVILLRFVIALPIGLYSGATGKGKSILSVCNLIVSSVPPLLYVLPTLFLVFGALHLGQGTTIYDPRNIYFTEIMFGLLVFVGIFQIAYQFSERASFFNGKLFVISSKTMGASNSRIVFRHILPQLYPEILFGLLTEFVQVLFLIGQLAIFSLFLGGADAIEIDDGAFSLFTNIGDWGGLIAYGVKYIKVFPWLIVFPCLFFVLTILILSFFSKQLQHRGQTAHMYKRRPLYKNKVIMSIVVLLAVTSAVLVTSIPNKSPAADVKQGFIPPKIENQLTTFSNTLIGYVQEGHYTAVDAYMDFQSELKDYNDPYQIFKEWNQKLHDGYQFVGTGTIEKTEQMYDVELQLKDPSGTSVNWHLVLTDFGGRTRIYSAK